MNAISSRKKLTALLAVLMAVFVMVSMMCMTVVTASAEEEDATAVTEEGTVVETGDETEAQGTEADSSAETAGETQTEAVTGSASGTTEKVDHTTGIVNLVVGGVILVVLIVLAQIFQWPTAVQPGSVVLCIILFNTPTDTYISYALNRILDTGVGVIAALFVNAMLPGGFTFRFMRRFYAWLGIQSDISHTGPEVPLIHRKNKK